MYVILGGTGHVGSATARTLLKAGETVTVVTRDPDTAAPLAALGARIAVADIADPDAVRSIFRKNRRAFLLNPPAAPDTDTDAVERESVAQILAAVEDSGLEWLVAESTYGAQPGERIGDLNTLHGLETGLERQSIPHAILRAAYYFSNWDASLATVRENGTLLSMFPPDLKLPMAAPGDLGCEAARLLQESCQPGVTYVEGPQRYSALDVARAFEEAVGQEVRVAAVPRSDWVAAFRKIGFSEPAAHAYARMTAITADGEYDEPEAPVRGTTTIREYVAALVGREGGP